MVKYSHLKEKLLVPKLYKHIHVEPASHVTVYVNKMSPLVLLSVQSVITVTTMSSIDKYTNDCC